MPILSLAQLEQKLEAAAQKLGQLKQRSFTLKKGVWQRQDHRALKAIHFRIAKSA